MHDRQKQIFCSRSDWEGPVKFSKIVSFQRSNATLNLLQFQYFTSLYVALQQTLYCRASYFDFLRITRTQLQERAKLELLPLKQLPNTHKTDIFCSLLSPHFAPQYIFFKSIDAHCCPMNVRRRNSLKFVYTLYMKQLCGCTSDCVRCCSILNKIVKEEFYP